MHEAPFGPRQKTQLCFAERSQSRVTPLVASTEHVFFWGARKQQRNMPGVMRM
jgi:hypothetical protein